MMGCDRECGSAVCACGGTGAGAGAGAGAGSIEPIDDMMGLK